MNDVPIQKIVGDPKSAKILVEWADKLGKDLYEKRLTTNQIRAIFGEVRQIQALWEAESETENRQLALRRFILLKPKMAYRARKAGGRSRPVEQLVRVLDPAIDIVINENDTQKQDDNFVRFVEFFEAILAYHKAYGGS